MSAKKKSDKRSKAGGKPKGKRKRSPEQESEDSIVVIGDIELPYYRCANCDSFIEPQYVHHMESTGLAHEDVLIAHHCTCCYDGETYVYGRYRNVPMAVAFLFGFSDGIEHVTQHGDGGWTYEAPLRQFKVHHRHPLLLEMRDEAERIATVDDFLRVTGLGPV